MPSNWTSPADFRCAVREGRYTRSTAGVCPGYTQGNLAILPRDYADEFLRFARLNPRPCPVIGTSEPGSSRVPELGDVDLLAHIPGYCVFRDAELVEPVPDLRSL